MERKVSLDILRCTNANGTSSSSDSSGEKIPTLTPLAADDDFLLDVGPPPPPTATAVVEAATAEADTTIEVGEVATGPDEEEEEEEEEEEVEDDDDFQWRTRFLISSILCLDWGSCCWCMEEGARMIQAKFSERPPTTPLAATPLVPPLMASILCS
jgi:hypothetical protein